MASNTPNLNLHKKDPIADQNATFNIDTMLNNNWDKIDVAVANKVEKIEGKALSTNDYTNTEKNKLAGIEENANKYLHPTTHSISMITENATQKIMTAAERTKLANLETEINTNINQQTKTLTNSTPTQHITAKQNCGVDTEVGGSMTVNLLGKDGDFEKDSNGDGLANGWNNLNITGASISNGTQTIKASTVDNYHYIDYHLNSLIAGHKYYVQIKAKGYNNAKVQLQFLNKKSDSTYESVRALGTTNASSMETLGSILTTTSINTVPDAIIRVVVDKVGQTFAGNATTPESVDVKEVMVIDLTAMGETGTDINVLNTKYPYTNSAQPLFHPTVEVCGKNLVKNGSCEEGINHWIGNLYLENNKFKVTSSGAWTCVYQVIDLKPNTSYYINGNVTGVNAILQVASIDGTVQLMVGKGTFNSGNYSKCHLRLVMSSTGTGYFDHIQLEQGTTATPYEPYKGGQIIFPAELSKINTYQDELTYKDGVAMVDRKVKHDEITSDLECYFCADNAGYKVTATVMSKKAIIGNIGTLQKYNGKILKLTYPYTGGDQYAIDGSSLDRVYITIPDTDSGWGESYTPTADEIKAYFNGWVMCASGVDTPYNGTGTKGWHKKYVGVGTKLTVGVGDVVSGTGTTTLPTEMNDMGYTPYQLYYALAEPIQEEIEPIILGDGVNLIDGQNTLTVKSGFVWEKANPVIYNNNYNIANPYLSDSVLNYVNKRIYKIIKDNTVDTENWIISTPSILDQGLNYAWIPEDNFDPQATYYVLYEVLQEDYNCQVQEAEVSYEDNIRGALNEVVEEVHNVQSDVSELQLTNINTNIKGDGERIEFSTQSISTASSNTGTKTITFKRAFADTPIVCVSSQSSVYTVGVNSITKTGCQLFMRHVDGTATSDTIDVNVFAIGK